MRREGSPWQGLGTVVLKELADHFGSVAHAAARLADGARCGGAALQRDHQPARHDGGRPVPAPQAVQSGRPDAVRRRHPRLRHSGDGDRPRIRRHQWRAQPPHAVAHPRPADLSRCAAGREIPRRPHRARGQPDVPVAAGGRARGAAFSACRRAARSSPARWCSSSSRSPMPASGWRWRCCFRCCSARRRPLRCCRARRLAVHDTAVADDRAAPRAIDCAAGHPLRAAARHAGPADGRLAAGTCRDFRPINCSKRRCVRSCRRPRHRSVRFSIRSARCEER